MKLQYIIPGLFISIVVFLFIYGNFFTPTNSCEDKQIFRAAAYKAVVLNKFFDKKNHNYRTLILRDGSTLYNFILFNDTSGFFEFVKPGDTVIKRKNKDHVQVNKSKEFRIYFDCK